MLTNVADDPTFIKLIITVDDSGFMNMSSQLLDNLANGEPKISRKLKNHVKVGRKKVILIVIFDYHGMPHHEFVSKRSNWSFTTTIMHPHILAS